MKKTLFGLVAAAALILMVSCAGKTPTQVAYQSIAVTEAQVLNAHGAYLDALVSHLIPTNDAPTITASFNSVQMALHAAASIASGGASAATPPVVGLQAQDFTNRVNTILINRR